MLHELLAAYLERVERTIRSHGLSLGDRACLALAQSTGLPVLTADRAWRGVGLDVEIEVIRT
jgi:PIN domain nuclease of toxin-antitoxin system